MQDHYDVKMPCHLLLAKLAAAAPGPVLASLEKLVGPLEKTLTVRLRGEPVKQEVNLVSLLQVLTASVLPHCLLLFCCFHSWLQKTVATCLQDVCPISVCSFCVICRWIAMKT